MPAWSRRLLWRIGRRIYCSARGEQSCGDIHQNGESFLQQLVLKHAAPEGCLQVIDVGSNQGQWTLSLLEQASEKRLKPDRLRVDAFEPVPGTAALFCNAISGVQGSEYVQRHEYGMSSKAGEAKIAVIRKVRERTLFISKRRDVQTQVRLI